MLDQRLIKRALENPSATFIAVLCAMNVSEINSE
jgi:hypothetical protein